MNSFLPNLRWLCIPSEVGGKDWFSLSQSIDERLEQEGLDLSEEKVYLLFGGDGSCYVARSVIGPKKDVSAPLVLKDWVAAPVWRETITGETLEELLLKSEEVRSRALKSHKKLEQSFGLCISRELVPELRLSVEAIFNE